MNIYFRKNKILKNKPTKMSKAFGAAPSTVGTPCFC